MNENIYWNGKGKYQEWYDELWKQVPAHGKAEKTHIDLVRCVSKLYYDHYNNGGGNWDVLSDYVWDNLCYWKGELYNSPEGDYPYLLNYIEKAMDKTLDYDIVLDIDGLLKSLDEKWELLVNIIVRYAWEKEHG